MSTLMRPLALVVLLTVVFAPAPAQAQGWKDRLKQKVKARVDKRADQAAEQGLDKTEATIQCAVTDQACLDRAKAAGQPVELERPAAGGSGPGAASEAAVGSGAWVNYDFVPGEQTLFYEDYAADEVGNFPKRLEFQAGNLEVVAWQGGRYLRSTAGGEFAIPLPEVLPSRFTLELEVYHGARRNAWGNVTIRFVEHPTPQTAVVDVNWTRGGLRAAGLEAMGDVGQEKFANRFVPIRIMADGKYVKVYMGDQRVANVPNAELGRSHKIWVRVPASDESPAYVGAIRVAAGGKKLYEALAARGRVATHGILFATGSAEIRGESTPTLQEIGAMLQAHPELKLLIEGHTDNTGSAEANQGLSEQRAAAVKAYLVKAFGIDPARLAAKGFGASKPVASNDTPEGRQQNRRVELVRQ